MKTVVLLSGGMDSTICLLHALPSKPLAVVVDYGQPRAELVAAERIAVECEVPTIHARCAVRASTSWHRGAVGALTDDNKFDVAFLPGRNLVLLTLAAAAVAEDCGLIVGATLEDQEGFPDCRPAFFVAAAEAISAGLGKSVTISAPLVATSKRDAYRALTPCQRSIVDHSVSCYRGTNCGECGACRKRKVAMS